MNYFISYILLIIPFLYLDNIFLRTGSVIVSIILILTGMQLSKYIDKVKKELSEQLGKDLLNIFK